MSVSIDGKLCVGCGRCAEVCPGNLIVLATAGQAAESGAPKAGASKPVGHSPVRKVARLRHPRDCWGCTACMKECPVGAICYFLGADMGGRGTTLSVRSTASTNEWSFLHPDGSEQRIVVDRTKSNQY